MAGRAPYASKVANGHDSLLEPPPNRSLASSMPWWSFRSEVTEVPNSTRPGKYCSPWTKERLTLMEEATIAQRLNESFQEIVSRNEGYDSIYALFVTWKDADDPKIAGEVEKIRDFFQKSFGAVVSTYEIPSRRPHLGLQMRLTSLISSCEAAQNSLLILYYAGHGDENRQERKSIWAAKGTGGPHLNWYEVQPTLSAWEGHTLMILDCCYALQAARDRDSKTLELLAASGLRERTPSAGEWSFTSALLEVMSNMVQENRPIIIEEVYKRLIRLEHVLATTPIRMILRGEESIELKSNGLKSSRPSLQNQEPLALLSLRISISRTFDVKAMESFQRWMRTHVPRGISAITVQEIFLKTASIQAFLQQHTTSNLQAAISEDLQSRNHVENLLLQLPLSESDGLQGGRGAEAVEAQAALDKLRKWNEQVYQSLQSNLLLNPSFYSEAEMERTLLSGPAKAIGLSDAARLRLLNMKLEGRPAQEDVPALPFGQVKREAISGIHRTAMHTYGKIGETVVFIERRAYNASLPRENVVRKVKRLARLLKEASTAAFHTAPFEGYIDEPLLGSFSLVFRAPLRSLKEGHLHLSLEDAYGKERHMPLDVRLGIAVALTRALSNLHAVGWLHKSLCSGHVLFFSKQHDESSDETRSRFDYFRPFLFGFDLSRPLLSSSDNTKEFRRSRQIYTHPNRWGTPRENFCPAHDIYSMGVILLEIGCWRAAREFDRTKRRFEEVNDEKKVREELVAAAKTYLPHCAGEQYCNAVIACLSGFPDGEARDREDPSKLHKAFCLRVLDVLLRASVCL